MGTSPLLAIRDGTKRAHWLRRLAPFALGALLLVVLRDQLADAVPKLSKAHPIVLLTIPLFFVWNQIATLAWRRLLRAVHVAEVPLAELARVRIEAQAVNQIVPAAGLAGEALRAVSADSKRLALASTATALDNAAGTLSGLVFALGAVALHAALRGGGEQLLPYALSGIAAFGMVLGAV